MAVVIIYATCFKDKGLDISHRDFSFVSRIHNDNFPERQLAE
jgi:hypothetical protein